MNIETMTAKCYDITGGTLKSSERGCNKSYVVILKKM